ncbi:DUF6083 domain-containing protein [Micromonospora sp. NPDC050417]|uniref:DUF6083 domain-containing protein n=1 Tax=Micromonospora sp. NPDC050417 TaxID=3364280 RepID=UPI0037B7321C
MIPVQRTRCRYCNRPVIIGRMQNGHWRTFHPDEFPFAEVPERERYAFSRTYDAVIDLIGVQKPPPRVLMRHYCAEQRERQLMENMSQVDEIIAQEFWPKDE